MARSVRASALALVAALLLPAVAGLLGPAGGALTPDLYFRSVHDYAVDSNNNTLYDSLVVELHIEVTVAGTYTVVCHLAYHDAGTTRTVDTVHKDFQFVQGNNTIELSFGSEGIYDSAHTGPFELQLQAVKIDYFNPWNNDQSTGFYDYRDFEAPDNPPPVPPDAPKLELDVYYVNITTTAFQVFVNRTSPEVVYRYRVLRAGMPDFVVRFTRLIFFRDDGDGRYSGEDVIGTADLSLNPWAFTNVKVSGAQVTFDLKARMPVRTATAFSPVNVSLGFLITNGTSPDSEFIRGEGAELKISLRLEVVDPIAGADSVAFEAFASDTLHSHDFLIEEPTGFRVYPSRNSTAYLALPGIPGSRSTVIGMVDRNLVEHAFFGWLGHATENDSRASEGAEVGVGASFRVNQQRLEVLLSYPYAATVTSLSHDPSVGVLPANLPPPPPVTPPVQQEAPNIYVWLFAVIVGAAILVLSVYARAKGY